MDKPKQPQLHLKPSQQELERIQDAYRNYCNEQRLGISLNQFVMRLIELGLEKNN